MNADAVRDELQSNPDGERPEILTWQQVQRLNCERKERFVRWDFAERAARKVRRNNTLKRTYVEPFRCRICGGVHTGTRPTRKRRIKTIRK
jgi:hypothetical protein